jgi:hypothetical protein
MALRWAHANEPRSKLSTRRAHLGERFDDVLARAMAIEPSDRFASGRELAEALDSALHGRAATTPIARDRTGVRGAGVREPTSTGHEVTRVDPVTPPPSPVGVGYGAGDPPRGWSPHEPPKKRRGPTLLAAAGLAAVALIGIGVGAVVAAGLLSDSDSGRTGARVTATPTSTATPAPTADAVAKERARKRAQRRRREREKRRQSPRPSAQPAPSATPAPAAAAGTQVEFQTGRDPGQTYPAAHCRIGVREPAGRTLYCWTPNDGYTLQLDSNGSQRVRADEGANKGRSPASEELGIGETRSVLGFRCISQSDGLRCSNEANHGWHLPRYRGLPSFY